MAEKSNPNGVEHAEIDLYSSLFDRVVAEKNAPTKVRRPVDGIAIAFSNTGRRSNGWFVLTMEQVVKTFEDLIANKEKISSLAGNPAKYVEAIWREIFETYLTDEVAQTMGKVQTLPLFELLSKIAHFSTSSSKREFKQLNLDEIALQEAKSAVLSWIENSKAENNIKTKERAISGGENVIFYGAPGTGKSNRVEREIRKAGRQPFRTVFHPDLQNSDFFGCLKPQMKGENVHYGFSPGPFMKALSEAFKTPHEPVFLVIEELNRAAAAAVFGDLFLLLDRNDSGAGEYSVSFPSPESKEWFEVETGSTLDNLSLPSNLYIYATMNSADQGVYPIDTAFRRRWRQEYLPLDYSSGPDGDVRYVDAANVQHSLEWRLFVKLLNEHLTSSHSLEIAEDRLLGQWFVRAKELDGSKIPEKVLLYLWDDLLRHEGREHIFDTGSSDKVTTYGDLVIKAETGKRFLSDSLLSKLNAASEHEPENVKKLDDDAP